MTSDVSFLPADDAERWSRPRIDWAGAARMAAGRLAAGAVLSDTDMEALRRADHHNDEGGPPEGPPRHPLRPAPFTKEPAVPAAPKLHPLADESRVLAAAKLDSLISTLTATAIGLPAWEPTPRLLLALADLASSARRHLATAA